MLCLLGFPVGAAAQGPAPQPATDRPWLHREPEAIRIATYNLALERREAGRLGEELRSGTSDQARKLAEVIQRVRPDVLVLNELDRDAAGENLELFHRHYLEVSQNGQQPISYDFRLFPETNTGQPSGQDLNGNGVLDEPDDAYGYGRFPGQYALAVLSRFPIQREELRTFQRFLWSDLPGAKQPFDPQTKQPYYPTAVWSALRLSSKNHVITPIETPVGRIHLLAAHPTPPVFDGPEDRNGCRNHDEIRFLADLIDPDRSGYAVDDQGRWGGLPQGSRFIVVGDLNADPFDGDSSAQAIDQLLGHPLIDARQIPTSAGAVEASVLQGGANAQHRGNPAHDTGDFNDQSVGNLRVDYVLPSKNLSVVGSGVFWPSADLSESQIAAASDHRLVWIDIKSSAPPHSAAGR
jgi:endonuclease/exonuclease/phosphatase family metal-dependent hydrolase